jgi:hypothetical protein
MIKLSQTIAERNKKGKEAEDAEDLEKAAALYEENIKTDVADAFAYERLMVIYRRQKAYKDEQRVIKRGIEVFKKQPRELLESNIASKKNKAALVKLSNAFMKGAGLIDKKGKETHVPEPVNKWMKRLEVVEKRLKKK